MFDLLYAQLIVVLVEADCYAIEFRGYLLLPEADFLTAAGTMSGYELMNPVFHVLFHLPSFISIVISTCIFVATVMRVL